MQNRMIAALFAMIFCAGFSPASASENADKQLKFKQHEWQHCAKDAECIKVDSACPGFYWAINRKFLRQHKKQNAYLQIMVQCGPPPAKPLDKLKPSCLDSVCTLPRP